MVLNEVQLAVLGCGLLAGITQYEECRAMVAGGAMLGDATRRRLVAQFDGQIADAKALLEAIEAAKEIEA